MKTTLFYFLIVLWSITLNAQTYIINDDFEKGTLGSPPIGWIQKYNGTGNANQKIVDSPVKNGTKSFQIEGQSNWTSEYYQNITSMPHEITIEAWVNAEKTLSGTTGSFGLGNYTIGTWGTRTSILQFYGGSISAAYSGGLGYNIQNYTPGIWYHIKLEHNLLARTFKVYIDDIQVSGTNGSSTISEFPMHPSVNSVLAFLMAGNSGTTKMFFDDVKVYDTTTLSTVDENYSENNYYVSNKILYFKNTQNLNEIKSIEVYNLLGQKVFKTSKIEKEISLKQSQQGIYILKVETLNTFQTLKIMIN